MANSATTHHLYLCQQVLLVSAAANAGRSDGKRIALDAGRKLVTAVACNSGK